MSNTVANFISAAGHAASVLSNNPLAAAGASGLSYLANEIFNSNEDEWSYNQRMARLMYDYQREGNMADWISQQNYLNEYNDPNNIMQRFIAAGLNPNLAYQNVQGWHGSTQLSPAPAAQYLPGTPNAGRLNELQTMTDVISAMFANAERQANTEETQQNVAWLKVTMPTRVQQIRNALQIQISEWKKLESERLINQVMSKSQQKLNDQLCDQIKNEIAINNRKLDLQEEFQEHTVKVQLKEVDIQQQNADSNRITARAHQTGAAASMIGARAQTVAAQGAYMQGQAALQNAETNAAESKSRIQLNKQSIRLLGQNIRRMKMENFKMGGTAFLLRLSPKEYSMYTAFLKKCYPPAYVDGFLSNKQFVKKTKNGRTIIKIPYFGLNMMNDAQVQEFNTRMTEIDARWKNVKTQTEINKMQYETLKTVINTLLPNMFVPL